MARVTEKEARTETVTKIVSLTCDVCGRPHPSPSQENDWGEDYYRARKVLVLLKEVDEFPGEPEMGQQWEVDMCPECFLKKLLPWVRAFGHSKVEPEGIDGY
jgi:hypothetical protein